MDIVDILGHQWQSRPFRKNNKNYNIGIKITNGLLPQFPNIDYLFSEFPSYKDFMSYYERLEPAFKNLEYKEFFFYKNPTKIYLNFWIDIFDDYDLFEDLIKSFIVYANQENNRITINDFVVYKYENILTIMLENWIIPNSDYIPYVFQEIHKLMTHPKKDLIKPFYEDPQKELKGFIINGMYSPISFNYEGNVFMHQFPNVNDYEYRLPSTVTHCKPFFVKTKIGTPLSLKIVDKILKLVKHKNISRKTYEKSLVRPSMSAPPGPSYESYDKGLFLYDYKCRHCKTKHNTSLVLDGNKIILVCHKNNFKFEIALKIMID